MKKSWIILVALALVSAGCIQLDLNFKVRNDGTGSVEMLMDMSSFAALGQGLGGDTNTRDSLKRENICNSFNSNQNQQFDQINELDFGIPRCEGVADYKVKLIWDNVNFVEKDFVTISESNGNKRFTFTFKSQNPSEETQNMNPEQLKALGMRMTMTVEMPGAITSTNAGVISNDKKKVTVDLLEETEWNSTEGIVIQSEEGTNVLLLVAVAVIVLIIIVAAAFVLTRKKQ